MFVHRLQQQVRAVEAVQLKGKMAGAVGNYNAHVAAYGSARWDESAEEFVTGLGLSFNPYVTQVRAGVQPLCDAGKGWRSTPM